MHLSRRCLEVLQLRCSTCARPWFHAPRTKRVVGCGPTIPRPVLSYEWLVARIVIGPGGSVIVTQLYCIFAMWLCAFYMWEASGTGADAQTSRDVSETGWCTFAWVDTPLLVA